MGAKVKVSSEMQSSPEEELANAVSHGIGAILSVGALVAMIVMAVPYSSWHVAGVTLFGCSLILLYLTSAIYHGVKSERVKGVFQIMDHALIFVLIAGSYMPWLLVTIRGPWGWSIFTVICTLMVAGIVIKLFYRTRFIKACVALYLAMGWMIVVAAKPMLAQANPKALLWLLMGGLCYSFGTVFFLMKRKYAHFVWHLWVLGGSACHVVAVMVGML